MVTGNTKDNKILNLDFAKHAADQTVETITEPQRTQKSIIQELMAQVESINPSLGGFEELAMLISLPDEQFSILAPIFLDELERSFNNTTDKTLLAQSLNAAGVKVETIREQYQSLMESIDKEMTNVPSSRLDFLKQMIGIMYNALADTVGVAKKVIEIPIEIAENAKMPTYANMTDSGLDIYALDDITVAPGQTVLVPTGLKVAIPHGYELQVRPKSGRSLKTKLRVANTPGTIDSGYRDEIKVIIENIDPPIRSIKNINDSDSVIHFSDIEFGQSYTIGKGEKFAQLVLAEVPRAAFYKVESVDAFSGDRGGGFGSTGLK